MTNSSNPVILGLGSNRGDSKSILRQAVADLGTLLEELRCSPIYISNPRYVLDQPNFFNCAVTGNFSGTPMQLLASIQAIEAQYGRDRSKERSKGERTLDIDILIMGSLVVSEPPVLVIPHPLLHERKFALLPLLNLEPEAQDPRTGDYYWKIYENLESQGIYYADFDDYNQR